MFSMFAQAKNNTNDLARKAEEVLPWLKDAKEFLSENAMDFGVKLIAALVVYIIGNWVAGLVTRIAVKAMERAKTDKMLVNFGANLIYGMLKIMVIIAALQTLGVQLTALTAILAAAGFAIGMALQGSLANFASGIIIIVFKPFTSGDFIEAGGVTGKVEEVRLFNSILKTGDNIEVIVPNGQITSGVISNYTKTGTRRIDLVFGCGYNDDLLAVKQYLNEAVAADDRILNDPEPLVAVDELGDSSVNFVVRPWVRSEDYWSVRRDLIEQVKLGFDERGFSIPFPAQDVFMHNQGAA